MHCLLLCRALVLVLVLVLVLTPPQATRQHHRPPDEQDQ